ncbi:hypothetical protein [Helicobacter saguini]|nr:hypothetical protein [Helicobacter saguini]
MNLTAWDITAIISGVIFTCMFVKFIVTIREDSKKKLESKKETK